MLVKVAEGVRFTILSSELFLVLNAYWRACIAQGVIGVVTGAQDKIYREDGAHNDGRALDFRSRDLKDPELAAEEIRRFLKATRLRAVVLFGPPNHLDHIHVHFAVGSTAEANFIDRG